MPIRILPPDLQKKSQNELNEIPDRIQEDLKHIRDWLAQQPHLTSRTDDQWLISFLRGCKFSLQRCKEKLDMCLTMRTIIPEFFSNRDPLQEEIQAVLKLGLVLPLPNAADPTAARIVLFRCGPADPSKVLFVSVIKTVMMFMDILMVEDDSFTIAGQQGLVDMQGATMAHLMQVTPSIMKKIVICLHHSYPTRPQRLVSINTPQYLETLLNIVKPLMTDKLKQRLNIYSDGNLENVYTTIPRSLLPRDYGGDNSSLEELTVYWKKKIESYRDWLLEDAKYCSNEKMRPGKPCTSDEVFGVEGSFRKLNVD